VRAWSAFAVLVAAFLPLWSSARAQNVAEAWTVQTVALRDLREAQATAAALKQHGFDAFTEFAMDNGLQFVRVRVGCFTSRSAAESMAAALRGRVTESAVVVEATAGAPTAGCVTMDVGFIKPVVWDEVAAVGLAPAFRVVVAGIEAHVVHTGQNWRVLQDGEAVPAAEPALAGGRFSQASVGGVALVRYEAPGVALLLCPGVLVTSVADVAISEQGDALVACSLGAGGTR